MPISSNSLGLCYASKFQSEPMPFQAAVDDAFLARTLLKVSLTRFVDDELDQAGFIDGPPTVTARSIADYWTRKYDWRSIEEDLNAKLQQFTVLVTPSQSPAGFVEPIPLHFVHHKSSREDAIPLLFVHGWPGSFIEVGPIIDQLTNPPNKSHPAFHVVAPSIPGYGFSPSPRTPGMGYRAVAATFHALMTEKLGYRKYVFQGGDAGDLINRYAAHDFPNSIVSGLSNFWVTPPTSAEIETYRAQRFPADSDENYFCALWTGFFKTGWGYAQIQQTRPLKLAHGLTDSPVGLAMWIYDSVSMGIEPERREEVWTIERVITWTMMHWLNGPYGAFSLYKQGANVSQNLPASIKAAHMALAPVAFFTLSADTVQDGAIDTHSINQLPYVTQPISISQFPYDIWYRTPLTWAQRGGNVVERNVHLEGGHFPSVHNSAALLQDIWNFFGNEKLSDTLVFGRGTVIRRPQPPK